jgi:hypothetical protein
MSFQDSNRNLDRDQRDVLCNSLLTRIWGSIGKFEAYYGSSDDAAIADIKGEHVSTETLSPERSSVVLSTKLRLVFLRQPCFLLSNAKSTTLIISSFDSCG